MVVSYNGHVSDYPTISCHMMTATTESVLDSVLVNSLVKNEPEDLTGQRHRHGSDISLDVGVTAKRLLGDSLDKQNMGLVTSPDGDSHIILNSKFLLNLNETLFRLLAFDYLTSFLTILSALITITASPLIVPCLWWSSCMSATYT